jgi:hypothetical protein
MTNTSTPALSTNVDGATVKEAYPTDIEQQAATESHLMNTTIHNISWKNVTVKVQDRETKLPKAIVDGVDGIVRAGKLFPIQVNLSSGISMLLKLLTQVKSVP